MKTLYRSKTFYDELSKNIEVKTKFNGIEISLSNNDFINGSYIIDKPGIYKLTEDIVFNPNSLDYKRQTNPNLTYADHGVGEPSSTQLVNDYNPMAFGIGFFSAIVISSSNVIIDLNGYTIKQSLEHYLQQRFFSCIELGSQPFIHEKNLCCK
jgi:hypothetical protein